MATHASPPGARCDKILDFFSTTGGVPPFFPFRSRTDGINLTNFSSNCTRDSCVKASSNFDLSLSLSLILSFSLCASTDKAACISSFVSHTRGNFAARANVSHLNYLNYLELFGEISGNLLVKFSAEKI